MKIKGVLFRISGLSFLILLIIFLVSPIISLWLPAKFRDHVYAVVTYQVIADKETQGVSSKEEQIIRLFEYVRRYIMIPRGSKPYDGKPLDYLIKGIGWCDYLSKTLNCLLAKKGIPARYAMLMDKEGNLSIHTLNEIFIKRIWAVFDPLTGVIFKDENGHYLTLDEISNNPNLISMNPRLIAINKLNGENENYYSNKLPMHYAPRRSQVRTEDLTALDHLTRMFVCLFKQNFSNIFQDIYLNIASSNLKDDYRLYYLARNYHLHYRSNLAKRYYNLLLDNYPDSPYWQDSLFFLGELYINQNHDYEMGIKILESLLLKYPDTKWAAYVNFYLGLAYDKMGDIKQANAYYIKAPQYELSTETINRLIANLNNKDKI